MSTTPPERSREHDPDRRASRVLQAGTGAAALLVLAGLVIALAQHGGAPVQHAGLEDSRGGLAAVWPRGAAMWLVTVGVAVLMATPIARLVAVAIGFARERDWRYVGLTCAVLLLTGLGWLVGRG